VKMWMTSKIASISHVSGDRVVKWDIDDDDDDDEDSDGNGINDVTLSLKNMLIPRAMKLLPFCTKVPIQMMMTTNTP
jgi:hypothetical protein